MKRRKRKCFRGDYIRAQGKSVCSVGLILYIREYVRKGVEDSKGFYVKRKVTGRCTD